MDHCEIPGETDPRLMVKCFYLLSHLGGPKLCYGRFPAYPPSSSDAMMTHVHSKRIMSLRLVWSIQKNSVCKNKNQPTGTQVL